jgi:NADPH2:quinone reductase
VRAYAVDGFGQAGTIRELPDPVPGDGEVLVRVRAAGLNGTDLAVLAGYMKDWFEHVFPLVPGIDASGIVERVGPNANGFAEGDEVYGFGRFAVVGHGTLAELAALPADALHAKPQSLRYEQGAVIGHSLVTAAAAVDSATPGTGDTLVLLGATGGVGSYATQLAAVAGARVIAVTLGDYADYARSLGAAESIDYTATDPIAVVRDLHPDGINCLIDLAGIPELTSGFTELVQSGGRVVSAVIPPDVEALAARGVQAALANRFTAEHRFPELAARIDDGAIALPAIQTFGFDDVAAALELQATRHVRGKVAVLMS